MFFTLNSWELALIIFAVVGGVAALGAFAGRLIREHSEASHEPLGVIQAALLGVVGLVLAFGLSLAVGRYQDRRADVVDEANAIGTAYLRAQTIAEPQRTQTIVLMRRYIDLAIAVSHERPGGAALAATTAQEGNVQRVLWGLAGQSLNAAPVASAPRLYVDSLNAMFDAQSERLAGLNNRVPNAVLWLELLGAAFAVGMIALYLAVLGKGLAPVVAAGVLVSVVVLVSFDLDRPTRGWIHVPATPLLAERASMQLPPAAPAPHR